MLKTKHALSAFCMLVAMTMATSAFAQGVFSVSSSIEPRARANGQTEAAGGITLTLESGTIAGDQSGTVVINYGTAITNDVGVRTQVTDPAPADTIAVNICGQVGTGGRTGNSIVSDSAITIQVDACPSGVIDVSGVLLAIADQGLSSVSANITSSGDVRLGSGANEVAVINSVVDELVDGDVTADPLTLIRHTADPEGDGEYFHLMIEENVGDSFDGAQINLEFDGILADMEVTIDAWVRTAAQKNSDVDTAGLILDDDCIADTMTDLEMGQVHCKISNGQLAFAGGTRGDSLFPVMTAMNNEAAMLTSLGNVYHCANPNDPEMVGAFNCADTNADESMITGGMFTDAVDVIIIRGKVTKKPGADDLPLGDLNITATADVGPIGPDTYSAFHTGATPIPRFASEVSHAVTVIDVESDQTELVVPYAVFNGTFDTGFAISNMNRASDQSGAVTFMLFQDGEDPVPYTTTDMLDAGGTMTILLSEILSDPAIDIETFEGYVEITTDFTDADGIAYISDWAAFSATATLKEK